MVKPVKGSRSLANLIPRRSGSGAVLASVGISMRSKCGVASRWRSGGGGSIEICYTTVLSSFTYRPVRRIIIY